MTGRALLGLIALAPALLGGFAPARAEVVTVALCSGRSIEMPLRRPPDGPGPEGPCYAKACHVGQSRKRGCR